MEKMIQVREISGTRVRIQGEGPEMNRSYGVSVEARMPQLAIALYKAGPGPHPSLAGTDATYHSAELAVDEAGEVSVTFDDIYYALTPKGDKHAHETLLGFLTLHGAEGEAEAEPAAIEDGQVQLRRSGGPDSFGLHVQGRGHRINRNYGVSADIALPADEKTARAILEASAAYSTHASLYSGSDALYVPATIERMPEGVLIGVGRGGHRTFFHVAREESPELFAFAEQEGK